MNKLFIVGNGFDLAHGLPTSYSHFLNDFWSNLSLKYFSSWIYQNLVFINPKYEGIFNFGKIKSFEDFFEKDSTVHYDLVYIDGNHEKGKTLQYFNILLKKATNDSLFIFDDIYWSPSMTEAWNEIKTHPKVTVSIDTFYWGLVFFRKEQEKQHFWRILINRIF